MDSIYTKELINTEDRDSGLDNTSESGHSGDEDILAVPSDSEDLFNSDCENKSIKNKFENLTDKQPLGKNLEESTIGEENDSSDISDPVTSKDLIHAVYNVCIELNNNEELTKDEYKEITSFYKDLAIGQCETVDFSITSASNKPDWFDEEKFKRGQKFAQDYLFCINFAELLSLFILFAQKSSLDALIFTGRSDSPFSAHRRYLNTLTKLMTWYEDDIWNDSSGSKNLTIVRGMHQNVYQKLTNSSPEELARKTTLGDPNTTSLWCPMKDLIVEDFRESLPAPSNLFKQFEEKLTCKKVWVNQADMSMTQFGFVGLAVTYPEYFGIYFASDEDLEAFLHLWRSLGYLLGIKDIYNYCNSDLKTVRLRTKFFLEVIAKPAFRNVSHDWEHMSRCLVSGISFYLPLVNFESSLLYLCYILKVETPRLKKQISWKSYIVFQITKLTFYLLKFRGVLEWLNSRLYEVIRKVQNTSPEVLNKWEHKKFSYMEQPGKCPIRGSCRRQDF